MKNLYDPARVAEVQRRLNALRPDSARQWGSMSVSQMLAHCSVALEAANGALEPERVMIGRLLGWAIKPLAVGNDAPIRRNSPTAREYVVRDDRDFAVERTRLGGLIDQFASAGPAGCTRHPHAFFGRMTPEEWSALNYKHLDHHFRQFGA